MQELIQRVQKAAGIEAEQAEKAIETVREHLAERMPPSLSGQLPFMLEGGTLREGIQRSIQSGAGDARDKMEEIMKDLGDRTEETMDKIRDRLDNLFDRKKED